MLTQPLYLGRHQSGILTRHTKYDTPSLMDACRRLTSEWRRSALLAFDRFVAPLPCKVQSSRKKAAFLGASFMKADQD
jgi:hypothetical protein